MGQERARAQVSKAQCFEGVPRLGKIPKIIIKISPKCVICSVMPCSVQGCSGNIPEMLQ